MKIRIALLLTAALISGLFWSLGSNLHAIVTHFIAPSVFAVAVALLFRPVSWRQQLLLLAFVLAVAELVRLVAYSVIADGRHYIASDGETQLAMLISFGLQCLIALLVWGGVVFVKRYEKRTG